MKILNIFENYVDANHLKITLQKHQNWKSYEIRAETNFSETLISGVDK